MSDDNPENEISIHELDTKIDAALRARDFAEIKRLSDIREKVESSTKSAGNRPAIS